MGKIASTLFTFLVSIPITAVGFVAIFGMPDIAALNASPSDEIVIRDPYDQAFYQQEEVAPHLGDSRQLPQSNPNNAPAYGQQPNHHHSEIHSETPVGGQARQPHTPHEDRSLDSPHKKPFGNQHHGHSIPNQPAARPQNAPSPFGSNTGNRLALNEQPNVAATMSANGSLDRVENPFGNSGTIINNPNTSETSAQMLTWLQASARLSELGIKYHLERGDREGSFLFVCLYQPQSTPHVTHRFEAEENDPLVAVNKVVGQVEGWLQQQYRTNHSATASRY